MSKNVSELQTRSVTSFCVTRFRNSIILNLFVFVFFGVPKHPWSSVCFTKTILVYPNNEPGVTYCSHKQVHISFFCFWGKSQFRYSLQCIVLPIFSVSVFISFFFYLVFIILFVNSFNCPFCKVDMELFIQNKSSN